MTGLTGVEDVRGEGSWSAERAMTVQSGAGYRARGPDVNIAHRLLKNHAAELIGPRPYALLTDAAMIELEVPAEGMIPATETCDRVPPIEVHILPLA